MDPSAQQKPEERPRRNADEALAASVPDDNHLLMRMIEQVVDRKGLLGTVLAGAIMLVWVVAKWGVPAILAAQTLILQLHGDNLKEHLADRDVAQQQLQATKDLGAGVAALGAKIDTQGAKLTRLGTDVDEIRKHQAGADQRMSQLSAQQAAQARQLRELPPAQRHP